MTSRDFAYWLNGFFELNEEPAAELSAKQVDCIKRHLALVFIHEIDPSAGPPEHQQELNEVHGIPEATTSGKPWQRPPAGPGKPVLRC